MKRKIKSVLKTLCLVVVTIMTTSCDLEVKEKFVFDDGVEPLETFGSTTPWQWIQGQASKPVVPPALLPEFSYMKQAIELTGLQNLYNDASTKRSFFLLKDIAWTKSGGIMATEFPGALSLTDPKVNINKLRNILLYHIITTYVDQGPDNLYVVDKDYSYNSLYTGTILNIVTIRRDRLYTMVLNANSSLITVATRKTANVNLHNYVFSNGNSVGHILVDYIKNEDFKSVP